MVETTPAYLDSTLSTAERVEDLLGRMTLPEKVGQMLQLTAEDGLEEPILQRHAGSILHTPPDQIGPAQQMAAGTRLGIPLLVADDCIHGYSFWPGATILPSQLGMACTWNPELVEAGARMTATEVAPSGIHWTFSPVLCIARELRWGRVDETFGEDPFLLGELGAAMVRGYQDRDILACAKHFAGYSETIGGRDASEAGLSRRTLRAWFLPPFERVAKEGARSFMLGYSALDGVPITANSWVLNEVLREEWGFTGTLVTDWDNVGQLVRTQKIAADIAEAAAIAVNCANDFIMTTPSFFEGAQEAVERGLITEQQIDDAVRRILTLKVDMGLLEDARLPDQARLDEVIGHNDHRGISLEQSRRSVVLLRNGGLLPLQQQPARIAVIGPNADDVQAQLGDWAAASGQVEWMNAYEPRELTETVLSGMKKFAPEGVTVEYARGAGIGANGESWVGEDGQPQPGIFEPEEIDPDELRAAVELAASSDVAVVVLGDNVHLTGEGRSTATLELMGGQRELLDAVTLTGTPVVLVMISGKPLVLPPSASRAAALLWAFNPGMHGGQAIAEIIYGQIEPSGRLPITIPRHVGQQPVHYNAIRGQHGERYADLTFDPLHAFGEGRGYTMFEFSDLTIENPALEAADTLRAKLTVTNTGARPGRETVQVYVRDLVTSATWADKELKHFLQVDLAPGESREVALELPASAFSIVNAAEERVVEPGEFELLVGHSSRDVDLIQAKFAITG